MEKSLKIIRYLVLGGVFFVPFIVLIVSESLFFPFITGKNFSFRILIEILFGLWLILALYDKKYRPKKSWILFFLIAFGAVLTLSSFFGENLYRSFWSNYERMEGLITHLHLLAYFFVLTGVLITEKLWKRFFNTSLAVSAIVGIYGLLQLFGKFAIHQSNVRLDATLGNASYLAIYMVFHIFIALFYFAREKKWYKWFYIPLIILQTTVLYHTATRGAILGLVGGVIIASILIVLFSEKRKIKIAAMSFFFGILILFSMFWIFKDSQFVKQSPVLSRFSTISLEETTTQSRFVIWKMSWKGFKEKPILGWGPENYNLVFNKYYEPVLYKQEAWFDRAHNVFFDRLTTNGILGLLAYLGLFLSSFYYLLLKRRKYGFSVYDSSILTGLLAAYFFHNLFVFDNIISFILFFAVLGYVNNRVVADIEIPANEDLISADEDYKKPVFVAIILVAAIFSIYILNVPALLASRNLLGAFQESSIGNFKGAFQKFKKSISYGSFGSTEASEHLMSFAIKISQQPNLDENFKSEVFETASLEIKKQIKRFPNDIRYMVFLGSFYNQFGRYEEAIDILRKAVSLSPRKQALYFELGSAYLNSGQNEKAIEVLRTAFELYPSFGEARKIYAVSLVRAGKIEFAEKILKEKYGTYIIADLRLMNAYNSVGEFNKVALVWEKIVEKSPNSAQYRVSLGAAYLQIGERAKAIEQLKKAIEIEPNFKDLGEYYISEILAGRNP